VPGSEGITIDPRLSHQAIAEAIGSTRVTITRLLGDLRKQLGLAMLFVTHNLPLVRSIADEVAVMSEGRIVEIGSAKSVIGNPQQEYTKSLITATPSIERSLR
jgi:ABC-type oligopeptide transport system ATPase subunit